MFLGLQGVVNTAIRCCFVVRYEQVLVENIPSPRKGHFSNV